MVLCRSDLKTRSGSNTDFNHINYGRRPGDRSGQTPGNGQSDSRSGSHRPSRKELIKTLSYWQSRQLLKEKERFPERKIRTSHKCYTEYFVAKNLNQTTGEQLTVAELVAENVSKKIVLLAFIATKPEVRCSGIGSELMRYFREAVESENSDATIFLEVDDPEMPHISEAERQIRKRRLNWYLRQGAVMWDGYYELPNALDKRRHGNKAIFMALPRAFERISYRQLQEAALEVLETAYGLSRNHWLYQKVQRQRPPLLWEEGVLFEDREKFDSLAMAGANGLKPADIPQTLSFLKAQLLDSTKYGALSPEEAIKRYLELERAQKLKRLEVVEEGWRADNLTHFSRERELERANNRM